MSKKRKLWHVIFWHFGSAIYICICTSVFWKWDFFQGENSISFWCKIVWKSHWEIQWMRIKSWESYLHHIFCLESFCVNWRVLSNIPQLNSHHARGVRSSARACTVQREKRISQRSPQYFWENDLFSFKWDTRNLHETISSSIETEPLVHFRRLIGKQCIGSCHFSSGLEIFWSFMRTHCQEQFTWQEGLKTHQSLRW